MNIKRNGIRVEQKHQKKNMLYEFMKRGTMADGYECAYIFTTQRGDFEDLKKQGYRYVRAFEVSKGQMVCKER